MKLGVQLQLNNKYKKLSMEHIMRWWKHSFSRLLKKILVKDELARIKKKYVQSIEILNWKNANNIKIILQMCIKAFN